MAFAYGDFLFGGPENDLRKRLRQNQIENTPGASSVAPTPAPTLGPNWLRTASATPQENLLRPNMNGGGKGGAIGSLPLAPASTFQGYQNASFSSPSAKQAMEMLGLKVSPSGYKATPEQTFRDDFEQVDQFQGRRLGANGGAIAETPLPSLGGTMAVASGTPLSAPMVGQRGVGGQRSAMFGAPPAPSGGQNLLRNVGKGLSLLGMAFSSPQQQIAMEQLNAYRDARQRREDAVKNWGSTLARYEEAGAPAQLVKLARAAGPHEGQQMISNYLAGVGKSDDDLVNVADSENGKVAAYTKTTALDLVKRNPSRYALAGAASQSSRGNYINMVSADGSGEPISVLEGSPEHQAAVTRRMVEAGPLSLNTRDPVRDRRVNEYQQLYGVNRATATKLADNLIRGYTDPLTGQTSFVDMVDMSRGGSSAAPAPQPSPGRAIPLPAPEQEPSSAPMAALPPPVPGRSAAPGEAVPMQASYPDPRTAPLLSMADMFGGKAPIQEGLTKATMGAYDAGERVNIARARYQLMKQDYFDMWGGASRMSNEDRARVEKAFPKDDIFESEQRTYDIFTTLADEARRTVQTQGEIANDASKAPQTRREAEQRVIAARKVLDTIGDPAKVARPGSAKGGLMPGVIVKGYRYKGGDPNNQNNWERVGK